MKLGNWITYNGFAGFMGVALAKTQELYEPEIALGLTLLFLGLWTVFAVATWKDLKENGVGEDSLEKWINQKVEKWT